MADNPEQQPGPLARGLDQLQQMRNAMMNARFNLQKDFMAIRQKGMLGGQGQAFVGPFRQMLQQRQQQLQANLQGGNGQDGQQQPTTILGMFVSNIRAIQQTRPRLLQMQPGQQPTNGQQQAQIPQLPMGVQPPVQPAGTFQGGHGGGGGGGGGGGSFGAQPPVTPEISL